MRRDVDADADFGLLGDSISLTVHLQLLHVTITLRKSTLFTYCLMPTNLNDRRLIKGNDWLLLW